MNRRQIRFFVMVCFFSILAFAETVPKTPDDHKGSPVVKKSAPGQAAVATPAPLKLSCELPKNNKLAIKIVAPSPRDEKLVDSIIADGVSGKHIVAIESRMGKTKSDYLNGADANKARLTILGDGLLPGLFETFEKFKLATQLQATLTKLNAEVPKNGADKKSAESLKKRITENMGYLKRATLESFRTNPDKLTAWNALKRPFADAGAEKIAKNIDEILKVSLKNAEWTKALEDAGKLDEWKKDQPWVAVLEAVSIQYGEVAKKNLAGKQDAPSLDTYFAALKNPMHVPTENAFFQKILLDYAVHKQAETILKLYCDSALKEKKELQVVTNDLYFPFLLDAIEKVSKNIPLKLNQGGLAYEKENGELKLDDRPLPKPKVVEIGSIPVEPKKDKPEKEKK